MLRALSTTLFALTLASCSEDPTEQTSLSTQELAEAIEVAAEDAPAIAVEEMTQEIQAAAKKITEESITAE